MKFGHVFKQCLRNEGFPPEWVDSAISYSQLKKVINRLTDELQQVGLDPQTLSKLLKHVEDYNASADQDGDEGRPFEYILNGDGVETKSAKAKKLFHPKLLFYVDEKNGHVDSASIDEETKRKLQMLAVETGMTDLRVFDADSQKPESETPGPDTPTQGSRPGYRTVEVPLTSDTEFFTQLTTSIAGLEKLQEREEKRMHSSIEQLGSQIAKLTDANKRSNKKTITAWRQVFQMYIEEGIFFGTTESDHKSHDADKATQRLATFSNKIARAGLVEKFSKKDNMAALNTFMHLNREILQGLRFGEINRAAMLKILKKFDKRTALGVKRAFPRQVAYPDFSEHLAKAVCAQVHTQILSHVPQLDDYSCPMCCEIEWRPVKLSCGHVFCIRCLIVMQNNKQHNCPFCRAKSVFDANSDNLDTELAAFLKKWFPDEVKAKQRYNEHMAGVDQYGEVYAEAKCVVM
ncbi:RING-14 protein [Didymella exigua CBS 183.55]|uniref:RING-14 protein n=1 Tax=Didymella exigua CBS 183.55 TaxID=1150837 RepID=A0A6A5RCU6_9PLEO|nr:RING-14 protein [Didymella exigua CBS 183.55]KAF1923577.1 RING-14 protein [Didymella exigua CBS 183.55]